jgi:hypothetical protein
MKSLRFTWLLAVLGLLFLAELTTAQYEWISYDKIDEIMEKINAVTPENCHLKQPSELQLIEDVVYHPPTVELLKKSIILSNRTQLLHTRNVAHKNAIMYSYQLQNLFDFDEPGLMYYYLHATADITGAQAYLNSSGVVYDTNMAYTHWYKNYFNKTVPRFGPYAWRDDDFYDAFNWRNEWTNNTIRSMKRFCLGSLIPTFGNHFLLYHHGFMRIEIKIK